MHLSMLVAGLAAAASARVDPPPARDRYQTQVRPFLAAHCLDCHGPEKQKGDLRLDQLSPDFATEEIRKHWLDVKERIAAGEMPPKKASSHPGPRAVSVLTGWIDDQITAAGLARRAGEGRVVLRRLNRIEYQNTVRDLLSVKVKLQDLLPEDTAAGGFDNVGDALHISPFLMEQYLEAADRALDAAIVNEPRAPHRTQRLTIKDERSVKPTGDVYRHLDDAVAIFASWVSANIQVTLWQYQTPTRGKYRFRISAYAFQSPHKPATFHVMAGGMKGVTDEHLVGYFQVPPDSPTVVELVDDLEAKSTIRIVADGLDALPPAVQKIGAENYTGRGLAVRWIEVDGPLDDELASPVAHRKLFGDLPQVPAPTPEHPERLEVTSQDRLADADRILRAFTRRAFRRPVTDEDVAPFMAQFEAKLGEGHSFEQAIRVALSAVMTAPAFLFLTEIPGKLDDFALATRLSYFLWSTAPDEELLTMAEQHKLRQPAVLRRQVERMLKDPKAAIFTENFVGQWLGLRNIDATMPDPTLYPEFNDLLKESMVKEPRLFFDEVLKNDLGVAAFVRSDFTFANAPLARHYGMAPVEGLEMRKVKLPPRSHRGGILTMAAVLKVTANGTNTSPVLRGAWVLDRLLGTPPPKPPADVPAVEPDIRGATTIREQLAKHRDSPQCAGCHAKIDPPGFALESFDVIGGWRENYRSVGAGEPVTVAGRKMRYLKGPPVDPSAELPDGRRFADIDGYKRLLLRDKDQLARGLTEKLLTYATGGVTSATDKPEIDAIVRRVRRKNYGLKSLVHEIVQSDLFSYK